MAKDTAQALTKIRDLVGLAQSLDGEGQPTEEARTAAVQAARLIREHELTVVPQGELDAMNKRIEGIQRELRSRDNRNRIMGAIAGAIAVKHLRF